VFVLVYLDWAQLEFVLDVDVCEDEIVDFCILEVVSMECGFEWVIENLELVVGRPIGECLCFLVRLGDGCVPFR
jgi:hypothetical protein